MLELMLVIVFFAFLAAVGLPLLIGLASLVGWLILLPFRIIGWVLLLPFHILGGVLALVGILVGVVVLPIVLVGLLTGFGVLAFVLLLPAAALALPVALLLWALGRRSGHRPGPAAPAAPAAS